ncbi:MAG: acyl-CoA thioesterase [Rickettsiales bacterium]|nr:acyl-CoA thioesterase [Rickettsiales bacterium]
MLETEPQLVIKVVAMPSDTNPSGDMFGGWIVSQMDLAAYIHVRALTPARLVTVAIDNLSFHKPVFVGDCLTCYAITERVGNTSLTVKITAMVERMTTREVELVTEGKFVFVAIGPDRKPVHLNIPRT